MSLSQEPSRRPARIPVLRSGELNPEDYARSTCFEAGHLVVTNAGWRNVRPVVDRGACTGCLQCYMHCPDGTIYKVDAAACDDASSEAAAAGKTLVAVDYDFCKGCGICVKMCAFDVIAMVSEREALAAEAAGRRAEGAPEENESEADSR